ncbi:MAG: DNA-processing protein DprA [Pseudomonadota bacterium]
MSIAEPALDDLSTPLSVAPPLPNDERLARLRLARSRNVGPRTYGDLMRRYGSAKRALAALPELASRGGARNYQAMEHAEAEAELAAGQAAGAELVLLGERAYPPLLAAIDNPPPALWVKGRLDILQREALAVVGARNASALGLRAVRRIVTELAGDGLVIVSGLARGIDAAAHETSLATGTIAVMAGGVDQIYPPEHAELAERIAETGCLISECPMGIEPGSRHFPRRNRLISGLARGVLLVEAAIRSGSLITARYALDQGREVMACPGTPEDPRAGGCNSLIRDGAALIRDGSDVREALCGPRTLGLAEDGNDFVFDADEYGDETMRDDYDALTDFDEVGAADDRALSDQVLTLLGPHPTEVDDVARECGVAPADLSLLLLELELSGQVQILPGGMVSRL